MSYTKGIYSKVLDNISLLTEDIAIQPLNQSGDKIHEISFYLESKTEMNWASHSRLTMLEVTPISIIYRLYLCGKST